MIQDTNKTLPTHLRACCYWAEDGTYWPPRVPKEPIVIPLSDISWIWDDDQYYHLIPKGADEEVVYHRLPHWIGEGPIEFVTE